jgi:hypothetical protein
MLAIASIAALHHKLRPRRLMHPPDIRIPYDFGSAANDNLADLKIGRAPAA